MTDVSEPHRTDLMLELLGLMLELLGLMFTTRHGEL